MLDLKRLTWHKTLILSAFVYFFGKLVARWIYPDLVSMSMVWIAICLIIILRIFLEMPESLGRHSAARLSKQGLTKQIQAFFPPEILGVLVLCLKNFSAALSWALRRPLPKQEIRGDLFEIYPRSQYGTVFLILIIACAVEVPMTLFAIGVFEHDPSRRAKIHFILTILTLFLLFWLIGDRHLVKSSFYDVSANSIFVRIGMRFEAEIPLSAIEDIRLLKYTKQLSDSKSRWLERNGLAGSCVLTATPFDTPNVVLAIKADSVLHIKKNQAPVATPRDLLLFVGQPSEFIRSILANEGIGRSDHSS